MDCTMNKAGTYRVDFDFNSADGRLWVGDAEQGKGSCEDTDRATANVPGQRISYNITVDPAPSVNNPPS